MAQLTLDVGLRDAFGFDNFFADGNEFLTDSIRSRAKGEILQGLLVVGAVGTGKTHLLHASCAIAFEQGRQSAFVGLGEGLPDEPAILDELERCQLVCVDNVDRVAGDLRWEESLFDLFNRCEAQADSVLVMTASRAPDVLDFKLRDLTSRLNSVRVGPLAPLRDAALSQALLRRARDRGLVMPPEVVEHVMTYARRDMHSLMALVDQLEVSTLERRKKVSTRLVKELLQRQQDDPLRPPK